MHFKAHSLKNLVKMVLAVDLSYIASILLKYVPSSPNHFNIFVIKTHQSY